MSMSIYTPYFYIIQHISSSKYYAGVKYADNSNPNNLLKFNGYQTSSNVIKQIILEEGLDSFRIRKIKVFETGEEALEYESRFLRRVNASFNESFLNRSNNSIGTLNVDCEKRKQTCLDNLGYEYPMCSPEIQEKSRQTNLGKYGCEYPIQCPDIQTKIKQTCLDNLGYEYALQSPDCYKKYKQTMLDKYGHVNANQVPELQEKQRQTMLDKYGYSNSGQVPELQEKRRQTMLDKYGYSNSGQVPEIQERKRQTMLEKYGYEYPSQVPEIQEKQQQIRNSLSNRPVVLEIKKYKDKFKFKLGGSWFVKKQEILTEILEQLEITYGKLD